MNRFLTNPTRYLCVAAVTAFALGTGLTSAAAQAGAAHPTIAVLPLENNSGDASQDFFAGGMTDEIAVALAAVQGLGVVARSSSFLLAPADRDVRNAGEKLNANYLVLGSARIVADRVRLNIRLVQAGDGAPLWSQDYDAERGKIFDLEEEIGAKIAAALKLPAGPGALVRSRTDFDTYLDFLRAKVAARPRGAQPLAAAARDPRAGGDARSRFCAGRGTACLWLCADAAVCARRCAAACPRRSARSSSARCRER